MHVILPEHVEGPHPVLWLLHGLSDDHTAWMRRSSIERYAWAHNLAVVMPAVNRSYYWNMIRGLQWGTFVREELPALARRMFPLSAKREDNFIAGLSMGGYGAFLAAALHPDRYAAAASLSGVLDPESRVEKARKDSPETMAEWEHIFGNLSDVSTHPANIQYRFKQQVEAGTKLPKLFACCGTSDFLYEDNLRFVKFARDIGLPLTWEEGPGDHTWDYWDHWIERVIDWLPIRALCV